MCEACDIKRASHGHADEAKARWCADCAVRKGAISMLTLHEGLAIAKEKKHYKRPKSAKQREAAQTGVQEGCAVCRRLSTTAVVDSCRP
jgi:hypothetical protein